MFDKRYFEFFDLFNTRKFFEAHEVLENLWREEKGPNRDFYQGLIQIAAAFVHVQKGNAHGAHDLMNKAITHLSKYPDHHGGLQLSKVLPAVQKAVPAGQFLKLSPSAHK